METKSKVFLAFDQFIYSIYLNEKDSWLNKFEDKQHKWPLERRQSYWWEQESMGNLKRNSWLKKIPVCSNPWG